MLRAGCCGVVSGATRREEEGAALAVEGRSVCLVWRRHVLLAAVWHDAIMATPSSAQQLLLQWMEQVEVPLLLLPLPLPRYCIALHCSSWIGVGRQNQAAAAVLEAATVLWLDCVVERREEGGGGGGVLLLVGQSSITCGIIIPHGAEFAQIEDLA